MASVAANDLCQFRRTSNSPQLKTTGHPAVDWRTRGRRSHGELMCPRYPGCRSPSPVVLLIAHSPAGVATAGATFPKKASQHDRHNRAESDGAVPRMGNGRRIAVTRRPWFSNRPASGDRRGLRCTPPAAPPPTGRKAHSQRRRAEQRHAGWFGDVGHLLLSRLRIRAVDGGRAETGSGPSRPIGRNG